MPGSRTRVGCRVTFITGPAGSPNVSPCIHNPVNMMDKFPGDGKETNIARVKDDSWRVDSYYY